MLAELYTEDAVVELPFVAPEPLVLNGRAAIAERFATVAAGPIAMSARNIRIYRSPDPELVVAEYDFDLRHKPTGRQLTSSNVHVMRVRDGRIAHSRDYHDHCGVAKWATER